MNLPGYSQPVESYNFHIVYFVPLTFFNKKEKAVIPVVNSSTTFFTNKVFKDIEIKST